jgi:hypothetical protein
MKNTCRILVGKHENNRTLGRQKNRWQENTTACLKERVCEKMSWNNLAQDMDSWEQGNEREVP